MFRFVPRVVILSCLVSLPFAAIAQTGTPVLRVQSRIVLTDVVVTDASGNPVAGVPRSAFHIYDNHREEKISTFEEHTPLSGAQTVAPLPAGVHTNASRLDPNAALNVLFIDSTHIDVIDQMFLYRELTTFVRNLPPNQPVAVYTRAVDSTVELAEPSADHALLQAALRKAIPHLRPAGVPDANEFDSLRQIAEMLQLMPGRKNVLWFNGGASLFEHGDMVSAAGGFPGSLQALRAANIGSTSPSLSVDRDLRVLFDQLEAARVAVYPIDARGLNSAWAQYEIPQHQLMEDLANATGGHAWYADNGFSQIAEGIVERSDCFYTIAYTPDDLRDDHSWHTVRIAIDGRELRLAYRNGYYDDAAVTNEKPPKLLITGGGPIAPPNLRSEPILFEARVTAVAHPSPESPSGRSAWLVHYEVPAADFQQASGTTRSRVLVGAAVLAFDHEGHIIAHLAERLDLGFDPKALAAAPRSTLAFDQQITLPTGDATLSLAVWDTQTGRAGILEVPLQETRPVKP